MKLRPLLRSWKIRSAFLIVLWIYVGSYYEFSQNGYRETDAVNADGFYFILPVTEEDEFKNGLCLKFYWPLVQIEYWIGTGRPSGGSPMRDLSFLLKDEFKGYGRA